MSDSKAPPATTRINNYNMALGRWLGMLLFSVLPLVGIVAGLIVNDDGGGIRNAQEFFVFFGVAGCVLIFGWHGWWAVLWVKFGDQVTILRFYGPQRLPWSEIKALRTGEVHASAGDSSGDTVHTATYKGLRIETVQGAKFLVLPTPADMASLKRTLEARGHSALLLVDPKANLTDT